ncbi:ATP-binding protein [Sorangium sp. So ce1128]
MSARGAGLFFEVVSRRHDAPASIVLSTTTPSANGPPSSPMPRASSRVVDRLLHRAEVVHVEGECYRLKEAKDGAAAARARRPKRKDNGHDHHHPAR